MSPEHAQTLARTERMAQAAEPFVGMRAANELARNVAVPVSFGDDCYQCAVEAIQHRINCFALSCSSVNLCASAMARAWGATEPRSVSLARRMLEALGMSDA